MKPDPGAVYEAAHKYTAWAEEARRLRRDYRARFRAAHPWCIDQDGVYEPGAEPLCVKRVIGDRLLPEDEWCQGCVEASALRGQYLLAVRKRAAAMRRIQRLFAAKEAS